MRGKPNPASTRPSARQEYITGAEIYLKRRVEYLAKARQLANPEDGLYVPIFLSSATAAAQNGDKASAEKILREVLAKRPKNSRSASCSPTTSPGTASAMRPSRSSNAPSNSNLSGPKGVMAREMEIATVTKVTNIAPRYLCHDCRRQAEESPRSADPGRYQPRAAQGRRLRPRAASPRQVPSPAGPNDRRCPALERARQLADKDENYARAIEKYEVYDVLARAYIDTRQNGLAVKLLRELVTSVPS